MTTDHNCTFLDHTTVEMVQCLATDASVVSAARISTQGFDAQWGDAESAGLINYLMSNRHGTPFEHNLFTFRVHAPIFVFREFHRHRIGWSYNEESGRYKELEPVFYLPPHGRNMVQVGKSGHYDYQLGTAVQWESHHLAAKESCIKAYAEYEQMIEDGIANEVARMHLPVNIFSSMWATCNARSLMAFLSLRQQFDKTEALFPSRPMREINDVADALEAEFAKAMPLTHAAFVSNLRVTP